MVNRATSVSPNAPNNPAAKPGNALGNGPLGATPAQTISAMLVDDEKLASDELAYLLKEFADVEVIATAANGLEAVKLIADLEPDLVFLDVQMPGLDGMGVIETGQRHEILDLGRAAIGALSQPNGGKLRERADRQSEAAFDCFHAGDEGGGNGSDPGDQDA